MPTGALPNSLEETVNKVWQLSIEKTIPPDRKKRELQVRIQREAEELRRKMAVQTAVALKEVLGTKPVEILDVFSGDALVPIALLADGIAFQIHTLDFDPAQHNAQVAIARHLEVEEFIEHTAGELFTHSNYFTQPNSFASSKACRRHFPNIRNVTLLGTGVGLPKNLQMNQVDRMAIPSLLRYHFAPEGVRDSMLTELQNLYARSHISPGITLTAMLHALGGHPRRLFVVDAPKWEVSRDVIEEHFQGAVDRVKNGWRYDDTQVIGEQGLSLTTLTRD